MSRRGNEIYFIEIVSCNRCIGHILEPGRSQRARLKIDRGEKVGAQSEIDSVPAQVHGLLPFSVINGDERGSALNAIFHKLRRNLKNVVFSNTTPGFLEKIAPFLTENAHPDGIEKVKGSLADHLDLRFVQQSILGTTLEI
jgi:hypothetical protein